MGHKSCDELESCWSSSSHRTPRPGPARARARHGICRIIIIIITGRSLLESLSWTPNIDIGEQVAQWNLLITGPTVSRRQRLLKTTGIPVGKQYINQPSDFILASTTLNTYTCALYVGIVRQAAYARRLGALMGNNCGDNGT